ELLERNGGLAAIRCRPGVKINHERVPCCEEEGWARTLRRWVKCHRIAKNQNSGVPSFRARRKFLRCFRYNFRRCRLRSATAARNELTSLGLALAVFFVSLAPAIGFWRRHQIASLRGACFRNHLKTRVVARRAAMRFASSLTSIH